MTSSSMVERARYEWRRFRDDEPGERFSNYRERLHHKASRGLRVCALMCGGLLVLAGIAMCFLPGPGLLVLLFGLAMIGGESRRLARLLDRFEPAARRKAAAAVRWWDRRSLAVRAVLIALAAAATGLAMRAWWAFFGP